MENKTQKHPTDLCSVHTPKQTLIAIFQPPYVKEADLVWNQLLHCYDLKTYTITRKHYNTVFYENM